MNFMYTCTDAINYFEKSNLWSNNLYVQQMYQQKYRHFFFLEHYNSVFCCTSLHCTVSLLNQFTIMPIAWIISISCNLITHVRLSMKSSRQNYFIALFISYSFLLLPIYTPMWVSTVNSVLTRVLRKKSQAYYLEHTNKTTKIAR